MEHAAEVGCPEFAVTWVRSGQWISFGGVVPDAVLDAPPVPGFHQVHIDTTVIDQGAATAILRDEALDLLSRMVHVPHRLAAGMAPAMARADQVGLPTLAQAPESWDPRDPRLVPFDTHGEVDAVLVLPTEHLVDERYRLTEQWAIEQLGSSDPQAARRLRRQRDAARSLRSWHPLDTDTSPSAYLATLRERTARLIELVRHHDASLTPPGRLRPGVYDPILAERVDTVDTQRTLVRDVGTDGLPTAGLSPSSRSSFSSWADGLRPSADLSEWDTVVTALESYIALHRRPPQQGLASEIPTDLDPTRLAQLMGGDFSPLGDVRRLFAALERTPGTLAFVRFAATPTRLHSLVADGQPDRVVPRWVIPKLPVARAHLTGLPEVDFSAGAPLNRQLAAPGTHVLLIDPTGNPTTIAALLGSAEPIRGFGHDRTVEAILDPPVGRKRPGRWGARPKARIDHRPTPIFAASLPAPGRPQLSANPPTAQRHPDETKDEAVWALVKEASSEDTTKVRKAVEAVPQLLNVPATPFDMTGWSKGIVEKLRAALPAYDLVADDHPLIEALSTEPETFLHNSRAFRVRVRSGHWWMPGRQEIIWMSLTPRPKMTDQVRIDSGNRLSRFTRDQTNTQHARGGPLRGFWQLAVPLTLTGVPVTASVGVLDSRATRGSHAGVTAIDNQAAWGEADSYLVESDLALRWWRDTEPASTTEIPMGSHWFRITQRLALMTPESNGGRHDLDDEAVTLLTPNLTTVQVIDENGTLARGVANLIDDGRVAPAASDNREQIYNHWSGGNALKRLLRNIHGPRFLSKRSWFKTPASAGLRTRVRLVSAEQVGTPAKDAWLRNQPTAVSEVGTRLDSRNGIRIQANAGTIHPLTFVSGGLTGTRSSTIGGVSTTATSSRAGQELNVPTVLVRTRYQTTVMRVSSRDRLRFWHRRGTDPDPVTSELEAIEEVPAGTYRAATDSPPEPATGLEPTEAAAVSAESARLIKRLRVATMQTARRRLPTYMWHGGRLRLGQSTIYGAERIATGIADRLRDLLARPENESYRDFLPDWDSPRTKRMVTRRIMQALLNEESLATQAGPKRIAADFLSLSAGHIVVRLDLDDDARSLALIVHLRSAQPDVEPQYVGIRNEERTPPTSLTTVPEESEETEKSGPETAVPTAVKPPGDRTLPSTPHRLQRGVTRTTGSIGAVDTTIGANARIRAGRVGFFAAMFRYLRRRQTAIVTSTNETFLDGGDKAQAVYVQEMEVTVGVYALKSPVSRINQLWKRLLGTNPTPIRLTGDDETLKFRLPVGFTISRDLTFEDEKAALATAVNLPEPKVSPTRLSRRNWRERTLGEAPAGMVTNWDHPSYVHGADALVTAVEEAVTQARQKMIDTGASPRGTAVGATTPASLAHYLLHTQLTPDRVAALLPTMSRQAVPLHGIGEIINDPAVSGTAYIRAFVETPRIGPQGMLEHAIEHGIAVNHTVNNSTSHGLQVSASAGPGAHAGPPSGAVQGQVVRRRTAGRTKVRASGLSTEIERNDTNYHDRGLQVPVVGKVRFVVHAVLVNEPVISPDSFFSASRSVTNATAFGLMMSATARRMGLLGPPRPPTSTEPMLFIAQPFNTQPTSALNVQNQVLLNPPRNLGSGRLLNVRAVGSEVISWLRKTNFPQQFKPGNAEPLIGDDRTGMDNTDTILDHTTSEHLEGNWGALIDGGVSILLIYPGRAGRRTVQLVVQAIAQDDEKKPTKPQITQVTAGPRNLELDVTSTATKSVRQVNYAATETVTEVLAGAVEPQRSGAGGASGIVGKARQVAKISTVADREMVAVDIPGAWAEVHQRITLLVTAYHRGKVLGTPLRIGHDLVTDKFANHLRTDDADLVSPPPVSWTRIAADPAEIDLRRWQLGDHSFTRKRTSSLRLPPQFQVADFRGAAAVQAAAMQALIGAGLAGDGAELGGPVAHALIKSLGHSMLWGTLRTRLSGPLEISIGDPRLLGAKMTLTLHSRVVGARLTSVLPPHVRDTRGGRSASSGTSSSERRIDVAMLSNAGSGRPGKIDHAPGRVDASSAPTGDYWGASDQASRSHRAGAGADVASSMAGSKDTGAGLGGVVDHSLIHSREPSALIEWTEQLVIVARISRVAADTTAAVMMTIPDAAPIWMDTIDAAHHLGFADNPRAMQRLAAANSAAVLQQQSFIAWRSANLAYERARLAAELAQLTTPEVASTSTPTPGTAEPVEALDAAWKTQQQQWHRRKLELDARVAELLAEIGRPKPPAGGTQDPFEAAIATLRTDPTQGRSARRLSDWIARNEVAADPHPAGESDCLTRAMGAFVAFHGRTSNQTVDESVFTDPQLPDLITALGATSLTPGHQVDSVQLWRAMECTPSAMMLVAVRPSGQPAHVYWLLADDRSGHVQLRWLDTQAHGLFGEVAAATDDRYGQLSAPGTEVLVLDGHGRPVNMDEFLLATAIDVPTSELVPDDTLPDVVLPSGVERDTEQSNVYWHGQLPDEQTRDGVRTAARDLDRQVVYLGVNKRGAGAPDDVVQNARRLIQQFALKNQQAIVVTEAALDARFRELSKTYGLGIVHHAPKSPTNGPNVASLSPMWRVFAHPDTAEDLGEGRLNPGFLRRAAELNKPINGSTSTTVRRLLLAPDRDAKLAVLDTFFREIAERRARSEVEADAILGRARDDLKAIVQQFEADAMLEQARDDQQVAEDPWFSRFTPLLGDIGAWGQAAFVLDYQEATDPVERARLLIDQGTDIPVGQRASLIADSGHRAKGAETAMQAVELMRTKGLATARAFIRANSGSLTAEEIGDWMNAFSRMSAQTAATGSGTDFRALAEELLTC
ncbi:hypothetical protein ACLQ24_07550 [Micromonospora sp. DT4]|uniref:hypothetical protein n=1 Tax=Micromonospora sp. DT4 TaxID=3393438 RepID=UPI003CF99410